MGSIFFKLFFFLPHHKFPVLVPWAETKPMPPVLAGRSPNHWSTREVPGSIFFFRERVWFLATNTAVVGSCRWEAGTNHHPAISDSLLLTGRPPRTSPPRQRSARALRSGRLPLGDSAAETTSMAAMKKSFFFPPQFFFVCVGFCGGWGGASAFMFVFGMKMASFFHE